MSLRSTEKNNLKNTYKFTKKQIDTMSILAKASYDLILELRNVMKLLLEKEGKDNSNENVNNQVYEFIQGIWFHNTRGGIVGKPALDGEVDETIKQFIQKHKDVLESSNSDYSSTSSDDEKPNAYRDEPRRRSRSRSRSRSSSDSDDSRFKRNINTNKRNTVSNPPVAVSIPPVAVSIPPVAVSRQRTTPAWLLEPSSAVSKPSSAVSRPNITPAWHLEQSTTVREPLEIPKWLLEPSYGIGAQSHSDDYKKMRLRALQDGVITNADLFEEQINPWEHDLTDIINKHYNIGKPTTSSQSRIRNPLPTTSQNRNVNGEIEPGCTGINCTISGGKIKRKTKKSKKLRKNKTSRR